MKTNEQKRWPVYIQGHRPPDQHPRVWVPIFFDPELARLLIESFLQRGEHERSGKIIKVSGNWDFEIQIKCDAMDAVMSTPLTGLDLDLNTKTNATRFKYGMWEERHDKPEPEEEEVETTDEEGNTVVVKQKVAKPKKEPKAKKAGKPKGFITITEFCEKWGMKPLHARSALRASDLKKPEYGWAFDPKDEAKLKKICGVK